MAGLPNIEAIGTYTAKEPFVLDPEAIYACEAIESLEALQLRGVNVFETHYSPYGLTQTDYVADVDADVKLITLISVTGHPTVTLPSSYLTGYPSKTTIPYSRLLLSVNLGLLPDTVDLASARSAVAEGVGDLLGITPEVQLHRLPLSGGVDYNAHVQLEASRVRQIRFRQSPSTQLSYWMNRVAELEAENERLAEALVSTQQ